MNTHDMIELPPLRIPDLEDELTAVLCAAISWGGSVISSEEYVAAKQRFRAAVNAAIEADRKRRGEPVGYIMPTAIKQLKAGGNAIVGGVSQGGDVAVYLAPQPAESCASLISDKAACGSENGDCDSQRAEPEHATLNLQPSSSMQPVATAFFTEQGEVAYTGIYDRTLKALEAVKTTRLGISSGSIDLYAAPQAAEPVKVPSDAEIGQILKEVLHNSRYGVHQWELWLEFASALFTRYGGGTP